MTAMTDCIERAAERIRQGEPVAVRPAVVLVIQVPHDDMRGPFFLGPQLVSPLCADFYLRHRRGG